jgi:endonuclease YncB( thermonuclease family)
MPTFKQNQAFWLPIIVVLNLLVSPALVFAGEYKVTRVIDGDTIEVKKGQTKLTVRLSGIDAPETSKKKHEPGQPFSQQSTSLLAKLSLNRSVDVKSYGADRYGRILGEVFADGNNVNLEMVKAGLAEVYRGAPAPGQDVGPYWIAEDEAKKLRKGMWQLGDKYESPREWRKSMKAF